MTERSRGLPSPQQVTELLGADFAQAGYEIEQVTVESAARPPRITVVADGDTPLNLDSVATLSRLASERLDEVPEITDDYLLEVSSPGVERPLTTEKHFRRARGRKVDMVLTDGTALSGRVAGVGDGVLKLVAKNRNDWAVREVALSDITNAVVQVEFSSPSKRELELVDQAGRGTQG